MVRLLKSVSVLVVGSIFVLGTSSKAQDTQSNGISTQDRDVLWFDQSFKIMTCDLKTTDSKCIGDPKSPMCVVETILASSIFNGIDGNDHQLRRIANGEISGPAKNLKIWPTCTVRMGYRVVSHRQFLRKSLLPSPNCKYYDIKVGDIAITIQRSPGCKERTCPPPDLSNNLSFLLRKGPYGWYRVTSDNRVDFTDTSDVRGYCPD